jgi:flagellar hook assembly protein FlgD
MSYSIAQTGFVSLKIYNIKGELIRNLVNTSQAKGSHSVLWDGKSEVGKLTGSGIYFIALPLVNTLAPGK